MEIGMDSPLDRLGIVEIFHISNEWVIAEVTGQSGKVDHLMKLNSVGIMTLEVLAKKHDAAVTHRYFKTTKEFENFAKKHESLKKFVFDWKKGRK